MNVNTGKKSVHKKPHPNTTNEGKIVEFRIWYLPVLKFMVNYKIVVRNSRLKINTICFFCLSGGLVFMN